MDVLAIRTLGQKVDVAAIPVPLAVVLTVPIVSILLNVTVIEDATFLMTVVMTSLILNVLVSHIAKKYHVNISLSVFANVSLYGEFQMLILQKCSGDFLNESKKFNSS